MRIRYKTLTLFAAILATAAVAGARNGPGPERPNLKQAGFDCPVCGSPCVSKGTLQRQIHQRRMQHQGASLFRYDNRSGPKAERWQQKREHQQLRHQARQQRLERFDFDEDGQLSYAERAARRAYRDALDRTQDALPDGRPAPQPPVE